MMVKRKTGVYLFFFLDFQIGQNGQVRGEWKSKRVSIARFQISINVSNLMEMNCFIKFWLSEPLLLGCLFGGAFSSCKHTISVNDFVERILWTIFQWTVRFDAAIPSRKHLSALATNSITH